MSLGCRECVYVCVLCFRVIMVWVCILPSYPSLQGEPNRGPALQCDRLIITIRIRFCKCDYSLRFYSAAQFEGSTGNTSSIATV